MALSSLLKDIANRISSFTPSPETDAKYLLEEVLQEPLQKIIVTGVDKLSDEQEIRLSSMVDRMAAGEPLAYILGWGEFHGNKFHVDGSTLIPRPETETLVKHVQDYLAQMPATNKVSILDVGAGSGCIGITLLSADVDDRIRQITALEPFKKAARVAKLNNMSILDKSVQQKYTVLGISAKHYSASASSIDGADQIDIIVSNPPYISTIEMENEVEQSVSNFEPHSALVAGVDGLKVYREILEICASSISIKAVFLELSPSTGLNCYKMFHPLFRDCQLLLDQFGRVRFLAAKERS